MDINAFHIYWKDEKKERNFKGYFTLTALLSALEWKKNNKGNLTFYTDKYTKDFFDKNDLLGAWDKIDDTTLDNEIDSNHFDTKTFYAIGKFIALKHEKTPCAMVDIDLIVWKNLEEMLKDKKSAFTHYEKTTPFSVWYPDKDKVQTANNYKFKDSWNFKDDAVNTSFIYFNDEKIKNYYINNGIEFMKDNFIDKTRENIGNPEILFVEQRLLPMCYKDLNIVNEVTPIIDIEWDAYKGEFTEGERTWEFFDVDNDDILTHTWIAKQAIEHNKKYETYMCSRIIEKILNIDDKYYDKLKSIKEIKPYIELLDQYNNTNNLLKEKIADNDLYKNKKLVKK